MATDPEDRRNPTLIHICLLRSPFLSFIFYSKVLSRSKRIGQSSQSDKREGRVVCACGWCSRHICVLIFFSLLFACCQQGASLTMFLVVFTNVSFIKRQPPRERHHPSAKVEVIIALNHLTVYLFGWLSPGRGRPAAPVSPREREAVTLPHSFSLYPSLLFFHITLPFCGIPFFLSSFLRVLLHL